MQLKHFLNKFINKISGNLPRSVFVWYITIISVLVIVTTLVLYWYSVLYAVAYGTGSTAVLTPINKHIINQHKLEETLKIYNTD